MIINNKINQPEPVHQTVANTLRHAPLLEVWQAWTRSAVPGERRDEALLRLRQYLNLGEQELDLSRLGLTTLPNRLPDDLRTLYLHHNRLTKLPDPLPGSLRMLQASYNQLTSLPALPPSLLLLCVDNNQLADLPACLPDSLELLSVRDNPLTGLPGQLPDALRYLDRTDLRDRY